jgi:glycosyltransferase involved in cell wall biosynthesis
MEPVRIAYLQKAPSGYADACLRALAKSGKVELFVALPPNLRDAPYDRDSFGWLENAYPLSSMRRDRGLLPELRRFQPHVTLIVGWEQPAYRHCARRLRGSTFRVVCMDNQWLGTPKQLLGIATSRFYLSPYFDAVFLPGARQKTFALKLGFAQEQIFEGYYSANVDAFRNIDPLGMADADERNAFVFIGRLALEKGIAELIEAYEAYKRTVAEPWKLLVLGTGPLESLLDGVSGIERTGFIEPADIPAQLARASFLVLPSSFEPWGVVVHEATAAGLGCICTSAVGAADAFVRDGVNGRIVTPRSVSELAEALRWAHGLSAEQRAEVSRSSRSLAKRFSPERWAATVLSMAESARELRRVRP